MLGVPGRAPPSPLCVRGDGHVGRRQDVEQDLTGEMGNEQSSDPSELHDRHPRGIAMHRNPTRLIAVRRPQPLGYQRHPHHDVADGRDLEIALVKRRRDPGGQDEDPDDLDKRQQPVRRVSTS